MKHTKNKILNTFKREISGFLITDSVHIIFDYFLHKNVDMDYYHDKYQIISVDDYKFFEYTFQGRVQFCVGG